MSLKTIHIVFITASTLLAFGFGVWSFRQYLGAGHGAGDLAFAIVSGLVGIALIVYGRYFLRKLKDTSYL